MAGQPTALNVYLAVDLLFSQSQTPLLQARKQLTAQKISTDRSFSAHCLEAEALLRQFKSGHALVGSIASERPCLSTITPLLPVLRESSSHHHKMSSLNGLFNQANHQPMLHAAVLMLDTVCASLAKNQRIRDVVASLTPPKALPNNLDPKWWWLLSQAINILEAHSVSPALEFLNKSLQPATEISEDSLEHPIWGMAYLLHHASKRTVLQDLEHLPSDAFSHGPATVLGFFMWLYGPELFPPSWLLNTVQRRIKKHTHTTANAQQLSLFEDNR